MGRFLTEHAPEVHAVAIAGSVELQGADGTMTTLATLQGYVENQGAVLAHADRLAARLAELGLPVEAIKTHHHGDLHLGQVLIVGSDVLLTGFGAGQGGASRERGPKESPLRDLASLLRSLDYAAATALIKVTVERASDLKTFAPLARAWGAAAGAAFMAGYREGILGCPAWPAEPEAAQCLLTLFRLEWAYHDLREELANRPDWTAVPLQALADMLDASIAGDAVP